MKAACKLVRGCYTSSLRIGVGERDAWRSLNEHERTKKDGNRRKKEWRLREQEE